jgi:hypothetical protein
VLRSELDLARRLAASPLLHRVARACAGVDVFLVGGSVRDRLLGVTTHDLDLVVGADVARCAAAVAGSLGGRRFTLGRPPNVTHRVVAGRHQIDLWQAEGALRNDILRRDFTVNALFWRLPRGPLIDLVGGCDDLAAGRIRVVRRANLDDDPLRVLRGVRLLATRPQLRLTRDTEQHLAAAAAGLPRTAGERIVAELLATLAGSEVARAVLVAARLALLRALLPAWQSFAYAAPLAQLAENLRRLARSRSPKLAAGARDVALGVWAAPAAGFPGGWSVPDGVQALQRLGLARSRARAVSAGAAVGERLEAAARGGDARSLRAAAVEAGALLPLAAAWAAARAAAQGADDAPVRRLLRWRRAFDRRPPLIEGGELAEVLALPADARRAEAVMALRLARARGEARTRRTALEFLRARPPR